MESRRTSANLLPMMLMAVMWPKNQPVIFRLELALRGCSLRRVVRMHSTLRPGMLQKEIGSRYSGQFVIG
jgi:hypothetical protein